MGLHFVCIRIVADHMYRPLYHGKEMLDKQYYFYRGYSCIKLSIIVDHCCNLFSIVLNLYDRLSCSPIGIYRLGLLGLNIMNISII